MHPCDVCLRTDFRSARGLAIHMSRIHQNRSTGTTHPLQIDDVSSDDEDRMDDTPDEPYQEEHNTEPIPDRTNNSSNHPPPIWHDPTPISSKSSSAILTQVCRTVQYPRYCGTRMQDPKWRKPWECADWKPWQPFQTSEDYDLAYAMGKTEVLRGYLV
jgi:hypothetical protein